MIIFFGVICAASSIADETLTVIVKFKNSESMPLLKHSLVFHQIVEMDMQRLQIKSRPQILNKIRAISVNDLWLINGAIVTAPASEIQKLREDSTVEKIFSDGALFMDEKKVSARKFQKHENALVRMRVPEMIQKFPTIDGRGIRIGLLDTGVDPTHSDLQNKILVFKDFVNFKSEPYDDNSHGTHVAGTLVGGDKSGTQIGLAPNAKLIVGKLFSGDPNVETRISKIVEAMQWIADPDGNPNTEDFPQVINNSWGHGFSSASEDPAQELLCMATDGWIKLGIVPVFAVGNSGPASQTIGLPAGCNNVIAVGASDENDDVAPFSARGPVVWKDGSLTRPTVVAPGVNIFSSVPGGGYESRSATSNAAPHAAGLAALIIQASPKLTVEEVWDVMTSSAVRLGSQIPNNDSGYGRIDALSAITNLPTN